MIVPAALFVAARLIVLGSVGTLTAEATNTVPTGTLTDTALIVAMLATGLALVILVGGTRRNPPPRY